MYIAHYCLAQITVSRLVCHNRGCPFHLASRHWSVLYWSVRRPVVSCSLLDVLHHAFHLIYNRSRCGLCVPSGKHNIFHKYPSSPVNVHMLSRTRICWSEGGKSLIAHDHVVNIDAGYNFIKSTHRACAKNAPDGSRCDICWKIVCFFCSFLCLPASPRPITMSLATHRKSRLSTSSVPRHNNVRKG